MLKTVTQKGDQWNESETYADPVTLRKVKRLTCAGYYNTTPTYHTGTAITPDGQSMIFASGRAEGSALMKADISSGQLTQLTDWVPDHGSLEERHKSANTSCICGGNGTGISMLACVLGNHAAVFVQGRSVRHIDFRSLRETVLLEDFGKQWVCGTPSVCPTGETVLLPLMSAHPELRAGVLPTVSYLEHYRINGPDFRLLEIDFKTGATRILYEEKGAGCAHCPHNPADPNEILIDRDRPPNLWCGGDGASNRLWLYRRSNHTLQELPSCEPVHFQTHAAWAWDGAAIFYHGPDGNGGIRIGAIEPDGTMIREYAFPRLEHYGHVSALAGRKSILLDGDLTTGLLLRLDYDGHQPKMEILARHDSDLSSLPWQYAHVHPQSDAEGRIIAFNAARNGRSDVYLLEL